MGLDWSDPVWSALVLLVTAVVFTLSLRRGLLLSRYPLWRAALVGLWSAIFWPVWLVLSGLQSGRRMREWDQVRATRRTTPEEPSASPR